MVQKEELRSVRKEDKILPGEVESGSALAEGVRLNSEGICSGGGSKVTVLEGCVPAVEAETQQGRFQE